MTATTTDLSSIGNIAGQLQTPVSQLTQIADDLGIAPALRINGIGYFRDDDVSRVAERVREDQSKITHSAP